MANLGEMNVNLIPRVKDYVLHHLFYLIIIAIGVIAFRSWLQEHDARLAVDAENRASQQRVVQLQQDITAINAQVAQINAAKDAQIAELKKAATRVTTSAQAIQELPSVANLHGYQTMPQPVPDKPDQITVLALPYYQQLNACQQDLVARTACEAVAGKKDEQLAKDVEIIAEKDKQIANLQRRPSFWKRLGGELKRGTLWTSVGIVVAKVLL